MAGKQILSQDEIRKVAQLARVELSEKEQEKFADELSSILDYFKDLSSADTSQALVFDHYELEENQFREDQAVVLEENEKEGIRKLFPQRQENSLKVKTVLSNK
jgi:aspartyl-tRNA(Asn)/glutamyl-tRNA(Gln) amidotransferase subunit C